MAKRAPPRRRTPTQGRSKETVRAIVEAAARVFATHGLERSTCAHIAKVAGVSVGSLYQYFPSKEAVVVAVFEREEQRVVASFLECVATEGMTDGPTLIRTFLASLLATYETDRALLRVLLDEVPRVVGQETLHAIDLAFAAKVRTVLEAARENIRPKHLDVASRLLVRTLRYNLIPVLVEPPGNSDREAFLDELTALFTNYLVLPATPRPASARAPRIVIHREH
jgi:AcrR family transcriptional regulator